MQFLFFVAEQSPQPAVEAINVSTLIITCVTIAAVLGWILLLHFTNMCDHIPKTDQGTIEV